MESEWDEPNRWNACREPDPAPQNMQNQEGETKMPEAISDTSHAPDCDACLMGKFHDSRPIMQQTCYSSLKKLHD